MSYFFLICEKKRQTKTNINDFSWTYDVRIIPKVKFILKSRNITLLTKVLIIITMVFPVVLYGYESWTIKRLSAKLMPSNCRTGEDSWESLGQQGDQTSQSQRKSTLDIHWKDWCWSWSSNTSTTWCKGLAYWKTPWYWARLKAGGEGDDTGWDDWMTSLTQWTWAWANFRRWWRTGKPGML